MWFMWFSLGIAVSGFVSLILYRTYRPRTYGSITIVEYDDDEPGVYLSLEDKNLLYSGIGYAIFLIRRRKIRSQKKQRL